MQEAHDAEVPTEVVLVVEDETLVRGPICRTLRKLGYSVLEADNGEDALKVMQAYHAPIHLVVTDVQMPEMDGAELITLLRDWYPKLRVLFISGLGLEYLEFRAGKIEGAGFLPKPFSNEELRQAVRETLLQPV